MEHRVKFRISNCEIKNTKSSVFCTLISDLRPLLFVLVDASPSRRFTASIRTASCPLPADQGISDSPCLCLSNKTVSTTEIISSME